MRDTDGDGRRGRSEDPVAGKPPAALEQGTEDLPRVDVRHHDVSRQPVTGMDLDAGDATAGRRQGGDLGVEVQGDAALGEAVHQGVRQLPEASVDSPEPERPLDVRVDRGE